MQSDFSDREIQGIQLAALKDQLPQVLKHIFGTSARLVGHKIANHSQDYWVLIIRLQHPSIKAVIKLAGPNASMASSFERTAMLNRLVTTQTSIPMPEIYAVDTSFAAWPWRYLVSAHISGHEWAVVQPQLTGSELNAAYHQIGSAVAQLHSIRFPGFGELEADGSVSSPGSFISALAEHADRIIKSTRLAALYRNLLDDHKDLFSSLTQAALCHEDLHQHNILFRKRRGSWQLATILDFDKAWAGNHEVDLARMEFWHMTACREFWSAYNSIHQLGSNYEQRCPIYQLLWCFEYAQMTPAHLAHTRQLCARLGLPQIDSFA